MSRQAFWSLMGMYNHDDTLLVNMNYPTEFTAADKDAFMYELFTETAELEVLYNDPDIMKMLIGKWSKHRKPIWDHLIETTQYEYDPIANWDRNESISESRTRTGRTSGSSSTTDSSDATITDDGSDQLTRNLTHTDDDTVTRTLGTTNTRTDNLTEGTSKTITNSGTDTTTNSVNGFEGSATNTVVVHDISALSHGASATESGTTTNTGTQTSADTGTITDDIDREGHDTGTESRITGNTREDSRTGQSDTTTLGTSNDTETFTRTYTGTGNIGTMTSQDMIKQEREIAMMDIIDIMIKEFKNRFLIQIY